jgi:DNA-binding transcriptional ArsR family regulator
MEHLPRPILGKDTDSFAVLESRVGADLATPLPISFAAVARHVGVLESAGLIDREVRGREHWLSVRSAGLRPAEEWIAEQVSFWSVRADALAARLERRKRRP